MKGLFEILSEKKWMVSPDFVHGIRQALEHNLNTHSAFQRPEKTCGFVTAVSSNGSIYYPEEYQISEDGTEVQGQWALTLTDEKGKSYQDFPFVSVLTVDGPITRNGGACSYGSINHRDMMIKAANHPLCRGHIFIINTPGGSAWAKNDYEQAIQYARSKGQPVIAFIDGMCASAGMYLAALCDERYYMHPKNEIGCVGVMAAFYTEKSGEKNKYTNETYHELYDPESFDKNKAFRDIANDGNDELLVQELATLGVEFRSDVKKACPSAITDVHLKGKVFSAEDVKGILVDDQSTFFDCITRAFALFNGTAQPIVREVIADEPANGTEGNGTEKCDPNKESNSASSSLSFGEGQGGASNLINMNNYPLINAACGLQAGEMVVTEEGTHMDVTLLDAVEARLAETEQLSATIADIENQLKEANEAKAQAEKALADAQEAHSVELTAKAEEIDAKAKEIEAKAQEVESLNSQLSTLNSDLAGVKEALATAEQTIADRDAQIAALSEETGNEPDGGESPENNGEGAKVKTMRTFDPSQYKTNAERKAAFEAFMKGK